MGGSGANQTPNLIRWGARVTPSHPCRRSIEPRLGSNWMVGMEGFVFVRLFDDDGKRFQKAGVKRPTRGFGFKKQCISKSTKHATKRGLGLGWGCVRVRPAVVCPLNLTRSSPRGWLWRGAVITVRGVRGGVPPSPDRPRPRVTWQGTPPTRTCSIGRRARRRRVRRARGRCLCCAASPACACHRHRARNKGPDCVVLSPHVN